MLAKLFLTMGMSKKITMKEFIMNDRWNLDKLKNILNDQAFQLITDIDIGDQNKEDYAIWNASADGQYSNKNAWHLIRSTKQKHEALNNMWHNCIPFKLFFLAWRLYFGKLPFDQVLAKFGNHIVSGCKCCNNPVVDTMQHTFI